MTIAGCFREAHVALPQLPQNFPASKHKCECTIAYVGAQES